MKVINLVDNGSKLNYGVWISAISTAKYLRERYGVESEVWFPKIDEPLMSPDVETRQLEATDLSYISKLIADIGLKPKETIVQSHGSWRFPTRIGHFMHQAGFRWVYTPHGMLNKHGFSIKPLKKWPYWMMFEKPMIQQADMVRVVSSSEKLDLLHYAPQLKHVTIIGNGIEPVANRLDEKDHEVNRVLFMSRLFHGKGVVPMVEAWLKSSLLNHPKFQLVIAGPDQGELDKVNQLLSSVPNSNVEYIGPIYKEEKHGWLSKANYFILPSFSEAFSTSILEAMSYGCVPLITRNCNFPEVFEAGLGIEITTEVDGIKDGLTQLLKISKDFLKVQQQSAKAFIHERYTLEQIARQQYSQFSSCLGLDTLEEVYDLNIIGI